jgi:TolB-like protein
MEMKSVQGVSAGSVEILARVIAADIAKFGFDVIASSDIVALLGFERQKQLLGCTENAGCIAEIGGSLGVEFVVSGQVGQRGSQYNVSLLVVDARKAKVVTRLSSFSDRNEDALLNAVRSGVATIVAAMRGEMPPPPLAAVARRRPWTRSRTTAFVSWGASAALLAGGVGAGLAARSKYDALAARRGEPGYDRVYADEERGIRTMNLAADALYVGAAGAAALGTWVWFRADREVAFVPTVAPGGAGLALAGSF